MHRKISDEVDNRIGICNSNRKVIMRKLTTIKIREERKKNGT
ncbi:hypothetical protein LCGC14_0720360 [marine sediment metagenome]|uniref:Uncharacterized protein n=1 Tax=marine sediment metagenome TaxID=412755 RepID=A0A0F9TJW4_9ZZZZ